MSISLQRIFQYKEKPVRTKVVDGQIYFVAKDVCEILQISKYRDVIAGLDSDERASILMDTLGGPQKMLAVNEYGLYNLIFSSRKPEARAFRRWVTHEVIPAIRKTGKYELPGKASFTMAEAQLLNAKTRQAKLIKEILENNNLPEEYAVILVKRMTELLIRDEYNTIPSQAVIDYDYHASRVLSVITKKTEGATKRDITRALSLPGEIIEKVLLTLLQNDMIRSVHIKPERGRPTVKFFPKNYLIN
ncbi:phage antirepressor [Desulfallas sp. Bu1-1]|uniref:BRO-N domain-containing protein n=1 Tax=Desulfallas sp. Bu1-1 TaxID=2787620 RepID=UPI00189FE296|nr:BRO family protein [Desulfallas sp. Bu1-1]MBF7081874.1 phage antirepressor [Desulfallas sp. Bu1-1]